MHRSKPAIAVLINEVPFFRFVAGISGFVIAIAGFEGMIFGGRSIFSERRAISPHAFGTRIK